MLFFFYLFVYVDINIDFFVLWVRWGIFRYIFPLGEVYKGLVPFSRNSLPRFIERNQMNFSLQSRES